MSKNSLSTLEKQLQEVISSINRISAIQNKEIGRAAELALSSAFEAESTLGKILKGDDEIETGYFEKNKK